MHRVPDGKEPYPADPVQQQWAQQPNYLRPAIQDLARGTVNVQGQDEYADIAAGNA